MLTRPVAVGAARAAALAVLPRRPGRDRQQAVLQVPVRGLAQLLARDLRPRRYLIVIPIAVRVRHRRCSRLAIIAAAIGCVGARVSARKPRSCGLLADGRWRGGSVTVSAWLHGVASVRRCGKLLREVQAGFAVGEPSLVADTAGHVPLLVGAGRRLAQRRPGGPTKAADLQVFEDDDVVGALLVSVQVTGGPIVLHRDRNGELFT